MGTDLLSYESQLKLSAATFLLKVSLCRTSCENVLKLFNVGFSGGMLLWNSGRKWTQMDLICCALLLNIDVLLLSLVLSFIVKSCKPLQSIMGS